MKTSTVLDLRGQISPLPTLKVAQHREAVHTGHIQVLSDDAAFPTSVELWCAMTGKAHIVEMSREDDCWSATIELVDLAQQPLSRVSQSIDAIGEDGPCLVQTLDAMTQHWKGQPLALSVRGDCEDFAAVVELWSAADDTTTMHSLMFHDSVWSCIIEVGLCEPPQEATSSARTPRNFRAFSTGAVSSMGMLPPNSVPSLPAHRNDTPPPSIITNGARERTEPSSEAGHKAPRVEASAPTTVGTQIKQRCAVLLSRDDPTSAIAALHLAEEAAREGLDTTLFFTGAAASLLARVRETPPARSLFFWRRKKVSALTDGTEAIRSALESGFTAGVRFVVCARTLEASGRNKGDLIARYEVQVGKARAFVRESASADVKASF